MRGMLRTMGALAALSAAAIPAFGGSRFGMGDIGPIIIGGRSGGEDLEDRRRRNLAAGGRDKRIKREKARRSYPFARKSRRGGGGGFGRVFKSDARENAFKAALTGGETRNDALKLARRVPA